MLRGRELHQLWDAASIASAHSLVTRLLLAGVFLKASAPGGLQRVKSGALNSHPSVRLTLMLVQRPAQNLDQKCSLN